MEEKSPLRSAFHALLNSMNGINIIADTYAYCIADLKESEVAPGVKDEATRKVGEIESYGKRADEDLKAITQILGKHSVLKDSQEFVTKVGDKLSEIGTMIQNVKNKQSKIEDYRPKHEREKLAIELQKLPEQSRVAAGLVQDLKNKLIEMGKYNSM